MRPLAFIDVETTGLDPRRHEIIEVGVIRVTADTLELLGSTELRVRPEHIDTADPEALHINGYNPEEWRNAVPLAEALAQVDPLLEGATLAGHNVSFDRAFLEAAWTSTAVTPPVMDHHLLDTAVLAWPLLQNGLVESLSLDALCEYLDIPQLPDHQAYCDALASLEVARWLLPSVGLMTRVSALVADERAIIEAILARIEAGRESYGPWRVDDGREYHSESLDEVVDGLAYCGAELVRLRRARDDNHARRRLKLVGQESTR